MLCYMYTKKRTRGSIRLREYDYASPGIYFVTLCTYDKQYLFGDIVDEKMKLNTYGEIACHEWAQSQQIRDEIKLDEFIIMPNHIHGIVQIVGANGGSPFHNGGSLECANGNNITRANNRSTRANGRSPLHSHVHSPKNANENNNARMKQKSISSLIAGYKSVVTKQINKLRNMPCVPIWQRNYYEHIIRNEISLNKIREYIINNPIKWQYDCNNIPNHN